MTAWTDYLLVADLEDVLKAVLPVLFMVLYGIAQLVSGQQQRAKRRPPAKPPAAPRPPAPERLGDPAAPNREQTLRREVEEFLRRAQGRAPSAPAPARDPTPRRERPAARPEPPTRRLSRPTPAMREMRPPAPPLAPGPSPMGSGVSQHVAEHLSTADLVQHAQHLGADVAAVDSRMQQHLQEKFTHKLGALTPQTAVAVRGGVGASPLARELVELLSRPNGLRQAIVAAEILRRPEERWS